MQPRRERVIRCAFGQQPRDRRHAHVRERIRRAENRLHENHRPQRCRVQRGSGRDVDRVAAQSRPGCDHLLVRRSVERRSLRLRELHRTERPGADLPLHSGVLSALPHAVGHGGRVHRRQHAHSRHGQNVRPLQCPRRVRRYAGQSPAAPRQHRDSECGQGEDLRRPRQGSTDRPVRDLHARGGLRRRGFECREGHRLQLYDWAPQRGPAQGRVGRRWRARVSELRCRARPRRSFTRLRKRRASVAIASRRPRHVSETKRRRRRLQHRSVLDRAGTVRQRADAAQYADDHGRIPDRRGDAPENRQRDLQFHADHQSPHR